MDWLWIAAGLAFALLTLWVNWRYWSQRFSRDPKVRERLRAFENSDEERIEQQFW